jgi:hypothetical protein
MAGPEEAAAVVWEWHDDVARRWQPLDAEATVEFEQALQAGQASFQPKRGFFAAGRGQYVVHLEVMLQVNTRTGFRRNLRRRLPGPPPAAVAFTWEFQDDKGLWKPYEACLSQLIQHHPRDTVPLNAGFGEHCPGVYVVDRGAMTQTNQRTQHQRAVRRCAAGQAMPAPAAAGPQAQPEPVPKSAMLQAAAGAAVAVGSLHPGLAAANIPHTVIAPQPPATPADSNADTCCICMCAYFEEGVEVVAVLPCSHQFHGDCIVPMVKAASLECPICKAIHGQPRTGNMPPGQMTITNSQQSLPGYPGVGCIVINYSFPGGIQVRSPQQCSRPHAPFPV